MSETELKETLMITYLEGYWNALNNYGIWNSGTQSIGCMSTPIKEAFKQECDRCHMDMEYVFTEIYQDGG